MNRVRLGRSGLMVSPICYGSWQLSPTFWGDLPRGQAVAAMRRAFEVGVNVGAWRPPRDTSAVGGTFLSRRGPLRGRVGAMLVIAHNAHLPLDGGGIRWGSTWAHGAPPRHVRGGWDILVPPRPPEGAG